MFQDLAHVERTSIRQDEEARGLALFLALREEARMRVAAAIELGEL